MIKSSRVLFAILCFAGMVVSTAAQTSVTTTGGTPNAVPKFTGSSSIGNSTIIESGGSVGIGTTAPSHPLDVQGYSGTTQTNVATFLNGTNGAYTSIDAAGNSSSVPSWNDGAEILEFVPYSAGNGIVSAFTGNLLFQTNSRTTQMSILPNGNVGIGTSSPVYKLDVSGALHTNTGLYFGDGTFQSTAAGGGTITGVLPGTGLTGGGYSGNVSLAVDGTVARNNVTNYFNASQSVSGTLTVAPSGSGVYGTQTTVSSGIALGVWNKAWYDTSWGTGSIIAGWAGPSQTQMFHVDTRGTTFTYNAFVPGGMDYAEIVRVASVDREYEPGDVLVIDKTAKSRFVLSSEPYSRTVAGVYSTSPGVLATPRPMDAALQVNEIPLALLGQAPCKATTENGPINVGDLLVTSATPGHVM